MTHSNFLIQFSDSRFLSIQECEDVARKVINSASGGGKAGVHILAYWSGNIRWSRNIVNTSGDIRNNHITVTRNIRGARGAVQLNRFDDTSLRVSVERAERLVESSSEDVDADLPIPYFQEVHSKPAIWSESSYNLSAQERASIMRRLAQSSIESGFQSAGYVEVSAAGQAVMHQDGAWMYYPFTSAQCSITVRSKDGSASGWAGIDSHDWGSINADRISAIALEKCRTSMNPVRLEPGRYTAILEPQAVSDFVSSLFLPKTLDRIRAELNHGPYTQGDGFSKIGQQVFDGRITVRTDCMDPDMGFPPFSYSGTVYNPATWVENGTLVNLAYSRSYAIHNLWLTKGLPASGAYRMSGGSTAIEDMIATTKRGLLVTRFWGVGILDEFSMLSTGFTRDGLWLIEHGKVTKAVRNFRITESPLHTLNNIEQLGIPQRVFRPEFPTIVPAIKVRDFGFSGLSDAI